MINKLQEALNFYLSIGIFSKTQLGDLNSRNFSIFASPRGGSTWLAQTLCSIPNSALVWEPLFKYKGYKINYGNPFAYPERQKIDISWNQYIPEGKDWAEAEQFFSKLFNREIINLKLYRFNDIKELKKASNFIFKFCFGNNLLPWIVDKYEIRPVFLLRHPCAVVASQLNYGAFDWHKKNIKYNYNMKRFGEEFYEPYRTVLDSIKTVEERLAAEWAMAILTPTTSHKNDEKWVTLTYEHLLLNPESALQKIFNRYKIETPDGLLDKINKTSFTKSSFEDKLKSDRLSGWKNNLSSKQISLILNFTERMGVDFYSDALEADYQKIYKEGFYSI